MDIVIKKDCIHELDKYLRHGRVSKLYIISDDRVAGLYMDKLKGLIDDYTVGIYILTPGEGSKSISTVLSIYDALIGQSMDRGGIILGLGGGVVGDIAGFVASTYMRGLRYIQIPTSLLAQVDSSIGGKVGIDYGGYKNMVGSFYFPEATIIDIQFLKTLPKREITCGLGEVLKYGLIWDYGLFKYTVDNMEYIYDRDIDILLEIVERSVAIKEEVVNRDRYDNGLRRILNFGHTVGHAIEAYYGFSHYNHGEAVILGMVYESNIAYQMGLIDGEYFGEIYTRLKGLVKPIKFNKDQVEELICRMKMDKKNIGDSFTLVLPISKGRVKLFMDVDERLLAESLKGEWI